MGRISMVQAEVRAGLLIYYPALALGTPTNANQALLSITASVLIVPDMFCVVEKSMMRLDTLIGAILALPRVRPCRCS